MVDPPVVEKEINEVFTSVLEVGVKVWPSGLILVESMPSILLRSTVELKVTDPWTLVIVSTEIFKVESSSFGSTAKVLTFLEIKLVTS